MRGRELQEIAERTRSTLPAWHYTVLSNYATKVEIAAEKAGRPLTDTMWKVILNKLSVSSTFDEAILSAEDDLADQRSTGGVVLEENFHTLMSCDESNSQAPISPYSDSSASTSHSGSITSRYSGSLTSSFEREGSSFRAEPRANDNARMERYLRRTARERKVRAQIEGQTVQECSELYEEYFGTSTNYKRALREGESFRKQVKRSDPADNYADEKIFARKMVTKVNTPGSALLVCRYSDELIEEEEQFGRRQFDVAVLVKPKDLLSWNDGLKPQEAEDYVSQVNATWEERREGRRLVHLRVFGILKPSYSSRVFEKALVQLSALVSQVNQTVGTRNVICFMLIGPYFYVLRYAPSAIFITPPIEWDHPSNHHLIHFLQSITSSEYVHEPRYTNALDEPLLSWNSKYQQIIRLPNTSVVLQPQPGVIKDDFPLFVTTGKIFGSHKATGRKTNVLAVTYLTEDGERKEGILKLANVDAKVRARRGELTAYRAIREDPKNCSHLAEALAIWEEKGSYGIGGLAQNSTEQIPREKIFTVVLLKERYHPITKLQSDLELLKSYVMRSKVSNSTWSIQLDPWNQFIDLFLVKGEQELVRKEITHCDPSDSNIMVLRGLGGEFLRGILIDYDLCRVKSSEPSDAQEIVGTWRFHSRKILRDIYSEKPFIHETVDFIESLVFVGLYITITTVPVSLEEIYNVHFNPYRPCKKADVRLSAWDNGMPTAENAKYLNIDILRRYFEDKEMIDEGWRRLKDFFETAWKLIESDAARERFTVDSMVLLMENELSRLDV